MRDLLKKRPAAWMVSVLLALAVLCVLPATPAEAAPKNVVKSLSVKSKLTVTKGSSKTAYATVKLTKKASNRSALCVTAKSSNSGVAKVKIKKKPAKKGQTGKSTLEVKGVKAGNAKITVTTVGKNKKGKKVKKVINVTVKGGEETEKKPEEKPSEDKKPEEKPAELPTKEEEIVIGDLKFDRTYFNVEVGKTVKPQITIIPENSTDKTVRLYTTDPSVATVDADGVITGVGAGTIPIIVRTNSDIELYLTVSVSYPASRKLATLHHKEVERAAKLGLVTEEFLSEPTKSVTVKEVVDLYANLLGKLDESKVSEWRRIAQPSDIIATGTDVVMANYYMAAYMTENGIPLQNGSTTFDGWDNIVHGEDSPWHYPKVWAAMPTIVPAESVKWYVNDNRDEVGEISNYSYALMYCDGQHSYFSKQCILPIDFETMSYHLNDTLTRENLALMLCRCYDSFPPASHYITLEEMGKSCTITAEQIEEGAAAPALNENGISTEWQGLYLSHRGGTPWDNNGTGYGGTHQFLDGFVESDFKFMKDHGLNYIRLQYNICNFSYPDYPEDKNLVNEKVLEELDEYISWGIKYGVHISFCMQGFTTELLFDENMEEPILTTWFPTDEQREMKKRVVAAVAERYKDIPPEYLSLELECEISAIDGFDGEDFDNFKKNADYYVGLANAIWSVDKDRTVSVSTDGPLGGMGDWDPYIFEYWETLTAAGIGLDYHLYEPRGFCVPGEQKTDPKDITWPYTDKNGVTWDMDKVYEKYLKPWKDFADAHGTSLRIGESGMFMYDPGIDLDEQTAIAWASEFKRVMNEHEIPYAVGAAGSAVVSVLADYLSTTTYTPSYRPGANWQLLTLELDDYTTQVFWDEELMNALYNCK